MIDYEKTFGQLASMIGHLPREEAMTIFRLAVAGMYDDDDGFTRLVNAILDDVEIDEVPSPLIAKEIVSRLNTAMALLKSQGLPPQV